MAEERRTVNRRQLLQVLVAAGISGPMALRLLADAPPQISVDVVRNAEVILGQHYSNERLRIIDRALQRNLDEFQVVRDLVIDDLIEPAPMFVATRR